MNQEPLAQTVADLEVALFAELQDGLRGVYTESARPDNDNPAKHLLHRLHILLWRYGVSSFDPGQSANVLWKSPRLEDLGRSSYRYSIDNPLPRPALHYVLHMAAMRMTAVEFEASIQVQKEGHLSHSPERWINWFECLLEYSFGDREKADKILLSARKGGERL